jgi:hypothetical protein
MIRVTDAKTRPVTEIEPGTLVIMPFSSDELLCCLIVLFEDSPAPLALAFKPHDGMPGKSPFLLNGLADRHCIALGKAEFYMPADLSSLAPHAPVSGNLLFTASGAALVGRVERRGFIQQESWLVSTGQNLAVDRAVPFTRKWDVGVKSDADHFEKVMSFPITEKSPPAAA